MPNQYTTLEKEIIGSELNAKQELFCQYYCKNLEFFSNATLSYAEAYGIDLDSYPDDDAEYEQIPDGVETILDHGRDENTGELIEVKKKVPKFRNGKCIRESSYRRMYNQCSANGSRLLRSDKIQARTTKLFVEMLNNDVVDAELTRIMLRGQKDSDRINAIKEHNALKARIIKKLDLTTNGKDIGNLESKSDDELAAIVAAAEQRKREAAGSGSEGGPGSGPASTGSPSGTGQADTGAPEVAEVHPVPVPGIPG